MFFLQIILSLIVELIEVLFFTLIGVVFFSYVKNDDEKIQYFLFAPLLGSSIWGSISVLLGMILPYNRLFLIFLLLVFVFVIIKRHKFLYIIKDKFSVIYYLIIFLVSIYIFICILPHDINDGIYFTISSYDQSRVALVNSISMNGLPPINPYLSLNGQTTTVFYHFGWFAIAAQSSILFGILPIISLASFAGTTFIISVLTLSGICLVLTKNKFSLFFLFMLLMTSSAVYFFKDILPISIQEKLFLNVNVGFWSFINDTVWSQHTMYAANSVIGFVFFYYKLLLCNDNSKLPKFLIGLAFLASNSFLTSVYSGIFAMIIFTISILFYYAINNDFRHLFNNKLIYQLLIVFMGIFFSSTYFFYMLKNNYSSFLIIGFLPYYKDINNFFSFIYNFFHFYLFELTSQIGIVYFIGIILLFYNRFWNQNLYYKICRIYIVISYLSIFFIHSSIETNDFGWRAPTPARNLLYLFSTIMIFNLYKKFCSYKKLLAYFILTLTIIIPIIFSKDIINQIIVKDTKTIMHKNFKMSTKGWETIRKYTSKNDLVLCNPDSFNNISFDSLGFSTNLLFSFYANRYTPIADISYTLTSFSGDYNKIEINEAYNKVVSFFDNKNNDINYIADKLKTKAILITLYDKIWNNDEILKTRYNMVESNEFYRVYILK